MITLAKLFAPNPELAVQQVDVAVDAWTDSIIKVIITFKNGRLQNKTFPVSFNIESAAIDVISEYEKDGFTTTLNADEIKKCRINWMVTARSADDVVRMLRILNAVADVNIVPDPEGKPIESQVVVCHGLSLSLSNIDPDPSLSTSFWTKKLTEQQAACLNCFPGFKPRMVDDTGAVLDQASGLPGTIAMMAQQAQLGDQVDAELEAIGVSYQPVNFIKLAQASQSTMIDF